MHRSADGPAEIQPEEAGVDDSPSRPAKQFPSLPKAIRTVKKERVLKPDAALRKIVHGVAQLLPRLTAAGQWVPVSRATQLLLWLAEHVPGSAAMLATARGTAKLQGALTAAAGSVDPAAAAILQPIAALLLLCVRLSECAADIAVETQSIRLLLQLLLRNDVDPVTKRHMGEILQTLAASKLVYRDFLHGAGIVETLRAALTDAAVLADTRLVQELLCVLASLSDDDVVYKDDMREAGLPALLVALFSVYQANPGAAELRPLAAQVLRCLDLMAHDDEQMRIECCRLGLVQLLVNQLHLDIHQQDEPHLPTAVASTLALNTLPSTPRSPNKANREGSGSYFGGSLPASSPLRRGNGGGSGNASPRPTGTGGGRRTSALAPPIPEDSEADLQLVNSESPRASYASAGRSAVAFAQHSTEAAPLRGLGAGPSPLQRAAAAMLLRLVLAPAMTRQTIEVLLHGMLLPALQMQLAGPRLSLAMEAASCLRTLAAGSPDTQLMAAEAGVLPLLVQLLCAHNIELATTAAAMLANMAERQSANGDSSLSSALSCLTSAAVKGLTELLQECAMHTYTQGLTRRRSCSDGRDSNSSAEATGRQGQPLVSSKSSSAAALKVIREVAESDNDAVSPSRGVIAQRVAETAWTADEGQQQQQQHDGDMLHSRGSIIMRQAAFLGSITASSNSQQQQRQQRERRPLTDRLTSRQKRSGNLHGTAACLVSGHSTTEHCPFCPTSTVLVALSRLLTAQPDLQAAFVEANGIEVAIGLAAGELGMEHNKLLQVLASVLGTALIGNTQAQDQVRLAGGVDVFASALARTIAATAAGGNSNNLGDAFAACSSLLWLMAQLARANSANKLSLREAGVLDSVGTLLDVVLAVALSNKTDFAPQGRATAILEFLAACLPDSPGTQAQAHLLGITGRLLNLLQSHYSHHVTHSTVAGGQTVGLCVIHVLGLLANRHQSAAQQEVTAGGVVAVVMNILQQQAMAGVLVSEVCMEALPSFLDGNPVGKQQALQYGVLPLMVHLVRSSPSAVTITAAARTLTVLADRNGDVQAQITAAGGLSALLDKLDPANTAVGPHAAAPAAAHTAYGATREAAAAEAAAEAEAEAGQAADPGLTSEQQQEAGDQAVQACSAIQQGSFVAAAAAAAAEGGSNPAAAAEDRNSLAESAQTDADNVAEQQAAAAGSSPAVTLPQQGSGDGATAAVITAVTVSQIDPATAAFRQQVALVRIRIACLHAVAAVAHDNMFTKNTARQQGAMLLLVDLLRIGRDALWGTEPAPLQQQQAGSHQHGQQQQHARGSALQPTNSGPQLGLRISVPAKIRTQTKKWHSSNHHEHHDQQHEQQQQQLCRRFQLQMLVASVQVLAELCRGNHSNQQAAAAEGLIDQLTSLAAAALGGSLDVAAAYRQLLAAVADALSAATEFCTPNKLVCRESGAIDVLSQVLLMAAEVPDVSAVLRRLRLYPAVAACCGAVVAMAQDCEEDQRAFLANPDFLPALFRLLSVEDPSVATQAARALEFIAIRNDIADDAEDRSEFEADTVMALVRVLSKGALLISGSGKAAVARVAISTAGPGPSAAVIKEAAALLQHVVDAAEPKPAGTGGTAPALGATRAATGAAGGSGATGSNPMSGLGTAPAHPTPANAGKAGLQHQSSAKQLHQPSSREQQVLQGSVPAPAAAAGSALSRQQQGADGGSSAVAEHLQPPSGLLPTVVTDHTTGLAVLRTWSLQEDLGGLWQQLVARTAPAFQQISAAVPEGLWRPFNLQIGWLLLLLAVKNPNNRAIISKVQRTTLTPLATQLGNVEKFYQQAAALDAAVAAGAGSRAQRTSVGGSSNGNVGQRQQGLQQLAAAEAIGADTNAGTADGVSAVRTAAVPAYGMGGDAGLATAGQGSTDDDEMNMLQQEVAFLGLMSSASSSSRQSSDR